MNLQSTRAVAFAFIDGDTTGAGPRHERGVEVARRVVRGTDVLRSFDSLVEPERSIPGDLPVGGADDLESLRGCSRTPRRRAA